MQGSLHVGPVIILLSIVLGAGVVARDPSPKKGVPEPQHRQGPVGQLQAGGCVNAVLVDVPELVVHGVAQPVVAFVRGLGGREVAVLQDRLVGHVRDHRVAPPVRHCADVVIVVVCDCIAHLRSTKIIEMKECITMKSLKRYIFKGKNKLEFTYLAQNIKR